MFQFHVRIPILDQEAYTQICLLQDQVAHFTGLNQPYIKDSPYFTCIQPIQEIDESTVKKILACAVPQMRQTKITLHALFSFGKHFIVLPALATQGVIPILKGIGGIASCLPEVQRGVYFRENILHVTIAEKTASVHGQAWSDVQKIIFPPMVIPITTVDLCRKLVTGGRWEKVASFSIPL